MHRERNKSGKEQKRPNNRYIQHRKELLLMESIFEQMEWVRRMNNICNRAEEIILTELVYD